MLRSLVDREEASPGILSLFDTAVADMARLGAEIIDPFEFEKAPGLEALDPVGAATERRFQRGFLEIAAGPVMLR